MSETQIPVPHKRVVAVDYVGVVVLDFDATIGRYHASPSLIDYRDEVNREQDVHEAMIGPADKIEGGILIQILAPLNGQSAIAKYLSKKGPGVQQYAIRVADLEILMVHLRKQGARVLYPEPKIGIVDSRINFIHPKDAGGVLLELVESAK